jgi:hypothetical protein
METLYFENNSPSGKVLIDLIEFGIGLIEWVPFIADYEYEKKGMSEKTVEALQNDPNNEDCVLIVVHDTSNLLTHPHRYFIRLMPMDEEQINNEK